MVRVNRVVGKLQFSGQLPIKSIFAGLKLAFA
jgi:hypothetical protein